MDLGLKGKVALVTGGSKGIGFATALALAKEGARVAICARTEADLQKAASVIEAGAQSDVFYVAADVRKAEDCLRVVQAVHDHFGRLDILVNNAGTSNANAFLATDEETWRDDLDLKLFAAIHCSKAAAPLMKQRGGGAIVNVTAIGGKTPSANSVPTTVSRAAGLALTKAMSKDLGPDGIRVNAVCIGLIRSDQIEKHAERTHPDLSWEAYAKLPEHAIPLGHIGDAEEAARVIAFLASDGASYVSGTAVNIDGGKAAAL